MDPERGPRPGAGLLRVGLVFYNVDAKGGMERQAAQLAARLAARGHAVRIVSTAAPRDWLELAGRPSPNTPRVPVLRVPVTRSPLFETIARAWLRWHGGVDLLYAAHYRCGLHAARIAGPGGPPVVVKYACSGAHGDFTVMRGEGRELLGTIARHVCISEAIRAEALAAGLPAERLVSLPNGVDLARWSAPASPAALPFEEGAPVLLFLGRLDPQKRVDVLLRAFGRVLEKIPGARLACAGAGPLAGELEALAAALGLAGKVAFLGNRSDVLELHRRAAAFVLPSDGEGMPNALLEALAAGTPAVATDVAGTNDVARNEREALLVPAGDEVALAAALVRILEDRELAGRLAAAGRERVRELYDLERVADRHVELFRALVDAAPASRGTGPLPGCSRPFAALAGALAPLLGVAAVALALFFHLAPARVERRVDLARVESGGGLDVFVRDDLPWSDADGSLSTLEVLEDGRPLALPHASHATIRDLGRGRFSHYRRVVHFSSSNGSDPRTNGRVYTFRHDRAPRLEVPALLGLAALLVGLGGLDGARRFLAGRNPALWIFGLVGLALAVRAWVAWRHGDEPFDGSSIQGVPFSDARGWFTLARELATGERWDGTWESWGARRPLYYVVVGSVLALTGPSLFVAKAFSLVLSAASAGFVFDLLRRVASRAVAGLTALGLALAFYDARASFSTMTEPLGAFLSVVALWALARAAERLAAGERARGLALAAGSLLALANLARPLNLGAAPFLALALPVLVWRRAGVSRRETAWAAGLFLVGVGVTLAPWIARQRVVHGISTISENTAEMLYAATSPRFGAWTPAVHDLVAGKSIAEQVVYFEAATRENLRTDPGFFVKNALRNAAGVVRDMAPARWLVVAGTLVLLGASWAREGSRRRALGVAVFVLGASLAAPEAAGHALWVGGALVVLLRREPAGLVLALLAPTVASMGAMGALETRFTSSLQWSAAALALVAVERAFERARAGSFAPLGGGARPSSSGIAHPAIARVVRFGAIGLGVIGLVGLGLVVARNVRPAPRPETRLVGAEAEGWIERAVSGPGAAYAPLRSRLEARRVRLDRELVLTFRSGEGVPWGYPILEARPYAFSVFGTRPPLGDGWGAWPGDARRDFPQGEFVIVGLSVSRGAERVFEVIAGTSADDSGGVLWPANQARRSVHAVELSTGEWPR